MSRLHPTSLGARLNLSLLVFLALVGGATTAILIYGFGRTQDATSASSQQALEELGSLALSAVVGGTAEQGGILFGTAGATGERASIYLATVRAGGGSPVREEAPSFAVVPKNGIRYDGDPQRNSDFILWPGIDASAFAVRDEIAYSAPLDEIFAALHAGLSDEVAFSPAAIGFLGVNGVGRFYPPLGVHETIPEAIAANFNGVLTPKFVLLGPEGNPERRTIWTAPYQDNAGQGLVVTAETPVYEGDAFRGVIQVDLLIQNLMNQIDGIRPTPGSFAFYVDAAGELGRGGSYERLTAAAAENPEIAQILETMQDAPQIEDVSVRKVRLDGAEFFIAYAQMPGLGGSFAVASPISEITAPAEGITAGIEAQGSQTLRFMLAAMGGLFAVGLVGATYLNRRFLVHPIAELVAGTRAIGAGALGTSIPVRGRDELGELAEAFNQMTVNLNETEGRYKRIFDSAGDGMTISRLDGTVIDANLAACEMHGYEWDEFLRLDAGAHVHPRFVEAARRYLDTARAGQPAAMRSIHLRKDGSSFDVDVRGVPFQYAGQPHVLSVIRDVTAEVRAEQILEDRVEERTRDLRLLLDVSQNVASTLEVEDLASRILDHLGAAIPFDGGALIVIDGDDSVILESRGGGAEGEMSERRFAGLPGGIGLRAVRERQVVLVPDSTVDPDLEAWTRSVPGHASAGRSWLAAPLIAQDRVLGVLNLWAIEPGTLGPKHADLAMAVANQAAIALENARLFHEASTVAALEERQRLARELHDSVSQALYGIALGAQTARQLLNTDAAKAIEPVEYVSALAEAGLAEMRALIFELRPESLATEGLVSALEKQVAATRARYGIDVVAALGGEPDLPLVVKEALYRVAQEAMHNTIKHARATRIDLRLTAADAAVRLEVRDDGVGFDASADYPGHLGLRSMRERLASVGGTIEIDSAPGRGTRISVVVHRGA